MRNIKLWKNCNFKRRTPFWQPQNLTVLIPCFWESVVPGRTDLVPHPFSYLYSCEIVIKPGRKTHKERWIRATYLPSTDVSYFGWREHFLPKITDFSVNWLLGITSLKPKVFKSAFTCNRDEISSQDETRPGMKKILLTREFHLGMKRVESDDYFFRKVTLFIIFVCLFSYQGISEAVTWKCSIKKSVLQLC